jgi:broad specificity phosphatase PhoE
MTTFALIRHAAHALVGRTIVGRTPGVQLSPEGQGQADALADWIAPGSIEALYSSPLERALATAARLAARLQLEVQIADELNEIDFAAWTNRTLAELHDLEHWRRFNIFRSGIRVPGGEAMVDVQGRMLRLVERLCRVHPDQTVALISHGDVIKAAVAHYLGVPLDLFSRIQISPASVSIVRMGRYGPEVC